jgi:hypothetical protein
VSASCARLPRQVATESPFARFAVRGHYIAGNNHLPSCLSASCTAAKLVYGRAPSDKHNTADLYTWAVVGDFRKLRVSAAPSRASRSIGREGKGLVSASRPALIQAFQVNLRKNMSYVPDEFDEMPPFPVRSHEACTVPRLAPASHITPERARVSWVRPIFWLQPLARRSSTSRHPLPSSRTPWQNPACSVLTLTFPATATAKEEHLPLRPPFGSSP